MFSKHDCLCPTFGTLLVPGPCNLSPQQTASSGGTCAIRADSHRLLLLIHCQNRKDAHRCVMARLFPWYLEMLSILPFDVSFLALVAGHTAADQKLLD